MLLHSLGKVTRVGQLSIGVRGGGRGERSPLRAWKFQGKLCFQGKRKLLKN